MPQDAPRALRVATGRDAAQIQAIYTPIVEGTAISFEEVAPGVDEMRRRIEATLAAFPWLVCARGEEVLGYAYAGSHRSRAAYRWAVDVSAYVRGDARGQGLGRALYTALLTVLQAQGFATAHAGIALPNPASVAFHEALGFRPVGVYHGVGFKQGAWHDVGWWQRRLAGRPAAPAEPRPFPQVAAADLTAALASGEGLTGP